MGKVGRITKVSGPVVIAENLTGTDMYEVVRVGEEELIGEVIGLEHDQATIQVYEETTGLKPGDKVVATGTPLSVELGPGIIGKIFDGIQRPLEKIWAETGDYIQRGVQIPSLDRNKKWEFTPKARKEDTVEAGDIIGVVQETKPVQHRIMVPPHIKKGEIVEIYEGSFTVEETIATIRTPRGDQQLTMLQRWPVRQPRPYRRKLDPELPLITGQRILDTFFPVAKGGTAAIPGGFGTGKTVTQQQLAKWADSDIVVYVGCGERGNEMAEVLKFFPKLEDPRTGQKLIERSILIANTSNMPVAAREASVYTGITLAEYFRDMGYDVALMADSTSRWAEAMREVSGRLEEMPGEEGYPAYLASRLAEFYERAGRVETLGSNHSEEAGKPRIGSVTVVGAVSPPGGDFSEPVTQNTLRITKVFWALDSSLADRRHFPAINWLQSYSLYTDTVKDWLNQLGPWSKLRGKAMEILQKESELEEIVRLVGPDALPERERLVLDSARMIREDFLQQNAYHEVDTYCPIDKQLKMLQLIIEAHELGEKAVAKGVPVRELAELPFKEKITRLKEVPHEKVDEQISEIRRDMEKEVSALIGRYGG